MNEIRCKNCNRLLYIQIGDVKQIKTSNNIRYNVNGKIEVLCKCGTINK